jgi:DinB superfamily
VDACPECGYTYAALPRSAMAPSIALGGAQHAARLRSAGLTARPSPDLWSPLEYACHVRDVLVVQRDRIVRTQAGDQPVFAPMDRDRRVVEDAYNDQDPAQVARDLHAAATALADLLDGLDDRGWAQTGVYNFPATAVRDVDWIARHTLHELSHHLMDVDRGLGAGSAA